MWSDCFQRHPLSNDPDPHLSLRRHRRQAIFLADFSHYSGTPGSADKPAHPCVALTSEPALIYAWSPPPHTPVGSLRLRQCTTRAANTWREPAHAHDRLRHCHLASDIAPRSDSLAFRLLRIPAWFSRDGSEWTDAHGPREEPRSAVIDSSQNNLCLPWVRTSCNAKRTTFPRGDGPSTLLRNAE